MNLHIPNVTKWLLGVMILIAAITHLGSPQWANQIVSDFGCALFAGGEFLPERLYTALTAIFLHAGWLHLAANGFMLAILSPKVHAVLGDARYLGLFVATGIIGNLTHAAINWDDPRYSLVIGASGAVFGLLGAGAYILTRNQDGGPPARKDILHFVVVILFLMAAYAVVIPGNVSWEAHAGGFLSGLILYPLIRPRQRPRPDGNVLHFPE